MSLETWKAEFYPEPANVFRPHDRDIEPRTELEAVRHSIKKWEGLLPGNMRKHEVQWGHYSDIVGDFDDPEDPVGSIFDISGSTCSLCQYHSNECHRCALFKVRGKPCDRVIAGEEDSPYHMRKTQPEHMVTWLRRAEDYVIQQANSLGGEGWKLYAYVNGVFIFKLAPAVTTSAQDTSTSPPICCPYCGSDRLIGLTVWRAYSDEDPDNVADLTEYQCEGACEGRSFWC